jgi:hypothetical protein
MAIQYYMRAFNTTLNAYVDWVVNDTPDSVGAFSGYPANQLINITVNRVVQSKVANFLKQNQSRGGTDGYFFHVNSYDWINATAPGTGVPLTLTGFAVERGVNSVSSISSASNASPINVTTAIPHGLVTGQIVTIIGVTGNINANGTWPITVTGTSNFTLNGSTGSGVPVSNTGNVYTPKDMSTLLWDETNQIWRFVLNTNGDGTTLGASQTVKVNNFLIDGYEAFGSPTASQGIIRLPNNQYIFGRNSLNTGDVQAIGIDNFVSSNVLNRIKLGGLATDVVYTPGIIDVDGYIQHDGTGSNTAQTTGFIREQNNTNIIAFRTQAGSGDIVALSSTTLNNVVLGDAVNGGTILNTATGNVHQFQVNSVPEVEIGLSFIRFPSAVVLPTIFQTSATNTNAQTMTLQAQNVSSGTGIGGSLNITSGLGSGAANGVINLQTGGTTRIILSDNTETFNISNITFATSVPAATVAGVTNVGPYISQTTTTAAGENMYIGAQSSSLGLGGNLYLDSGLGNTLANDGYTVLRAGGISQMVISAQNFPALHFPASGGKVTVLGNLEVQGTLTTVDSTTVDIVGAVIHGNWSDPTVNPNVGIPLTVVGYSSHRGNSGGNPRDGASLIWTEGPTANNTLFGVTVAPTTSNLFPSDGYWRAISTPGDGFGIDGYTASNAFSTLGVFANSFVSTFDPNPALGTISGSGSLRNPNNVPVVTSRNLTASTTLVVSGSTPLTLPQGTLNVVSTTGFTTPTGTLFVQSSAGTQTITYTNTTGTSFTGCVGGSGTIVTGGIVGQAVQTTTIASGSNNQAVPGVGNIISVASTTGFPQTGTLRVVTYGNTNGVPGNGSGIVSINYTGISGSTFTGCTVATGSPTGGILYTGNVVQLASIAGNADIHLLGSDFANHILHGLAGLTNNGHIFNTAAAAPYIPYDFQVGSVSQIQLANADTDADGYTETVQVSPTVSNPRIYQLAQPYTGANAGFNMMLQAQAGQNVTAGTNNNGGGLTLASGPAGTGGTGGVAGQVSINIGSTPSGIFNSIDFEADGYAEWFAAGSTIVNPRLYQITQSGTGANNGFNFKINAQAGQQQSGANNNNSGGNLAFASGVPGTGGSGTAGTPGQIEFLWGSTLELTLTDGSLQWSNLTTTNPIFSQADTNVNSATGQTTTLRAQNATGTTTNGGPLTLSSGSGTTAHGNVNIQTGSGTRVLVTTSFTAFNDSTAAEALRITPVSTGTTQITYATGVTSAQINQTATSGTTGAPMSVQAQAGASGTGGALSVIAGNATTTGGALNLASGSGATNGVINFQPGGTTQILITSTGQFIQWVSTMANPTLNQATTGGASGTTLTVQAQNAATTGGNLALTSGTGATAGNVNLQTGAATRVSVNPTFTSFLDTAEALRITPVSAGTTQITFASTDTAAQINQTTTGGATGANMTMHAQNAATTGGNAIITSGTGATAGNVQLQTGAVDRVVVHPTFTEFRDTSEAYRITPVSAGATTLQAINTATSVTYKQGDNTTASTTGATTTVQSQNSTAATANGGDLNLTSGSGTQFDGYLHLQAGGSSVVTVHTNKISYLKGRRRHVTSVTGTYQVLVTDDYLAITTLTGAFTITLPANPLTGDEYWIKDTTGNASTFNVTVSGNGNNIDGNANFVFTQSYGAATFTFTGTQWSIS